MYFALSAGQRERLEFTAACPARHSPQLSIVSAALILAQGMLANASLHGTGCRVPAADSSPGTAAAAGRSKMVQVADGSELMLQHHLLLVISRYTSKRPCEPAPVSACSEVWSQRVVKVQHSTCTG